MNKTNQLELYRNTNCLPLRFASFATKLIPRGKGMVPRSLGKLFRPWIHHSLLTRHGALLPIVPDALDVYTTMMMQDNSWDYWVFRAMNKYTQNGGIVYDIGANVGYMTIELANLRKDDDVKVVSFEPQSLLSNNIRLAKELNQLDNITVIEAAVGSKDEIIDLYMFNHSIHASAVATDHSSTKQQVRQITIDTLVNEGSIKPPDLIKIDIEGYELEALRGARETIQEYKPIIIFEYSLTTLLSGKTFSDYQKYFTQIGGYEYQSIHGDYLDESKVELGDGEHLDILMKPIS